MKKLNGTVVSILSGAVAGIILAAGSLYMGHWLQKNKIDCENIPTPRVEAELSPSQTYLMHKRAHQERLGFAQPAPSLTCEWPRDTNNPQCLPRTPELQDKLQGSK